MNGEDVSEIAIIGLRPNVRIAAGVDELRVDPHLAARALHTALEYMRYAKLFPDLAQVTRDSGLVLHYAGAADHFQICDFGEVGQDFILHAIREKRVRFFLAQIFKGKNCDAFSGYI